MGRLTELFALIDMTAEDRKKYVYGNNKDIYFSHLTIDDDILKNIKPKKKWDISPTKRTGRKNTSKA